MHGPADISKDALVVGERAGRWALTGGVVGIVALLGALGAAYGGAGWSRFLTRGSWAACSS